MRWDDLFADLAGQLDAGLGAEQAELVAELTRAERAGVGLAERFRAHRGQPARGSHGQRAHGAPSGTVRLVLATGESLTGEVRDAGTDWVLLASGPREHLVPLAAVAAVGGLTERVAPRDGPARGRLGITTALRALARDRQLVRLATTGAEVTGLVVAVGADHLDLAPVSGETGRPTGERLTVPLRALVRITHG